MRNLAKTTLILLTCTWFLAGCAGLSTTQPNSQPADQKETVKPSEIDEPPTVTDPEPSDTSSSEPPDPLEIHPTLTLPPGLEPAETPESAPLMGEVPPEILEAVFADLTERTGAVRENILVLRAEAVVWNDGSLGCPKPGEFYIQVLINGYWLVLEVEGVYYDYRVSDSGNIILCLEGPMPPISPQDASGQTQNHMVSQAKDDLAQRLGVPVDEIELIKFEEVTWRDGSLGCPQPGMLYTQALVNGSLIQLLHKETIYQYHSGKGGKPFLCENPAQGFEAGISPGEEYSPPPELSEQ